MGEAKNKKACKINDLQAFSKERIKLMELFDSTFADRTGLEPATSAVTGRHSNQLNYRSNYFENLLSPNFTHQQLAFFRTAKIASPHFLTKCFSNPSFTICSPSPYLPLINLVII